MQKRDVLNSPRLKEIHKERGRASRRRLIFLSLFSILILGGLALLSHSEKLSIKNIEISGNQVVSSTEITEEINKILDSRYIFLFSKRNFLIYPKNKIAERLSGEFKRLTEIKINLREANTLSVAVKERSGVYTWCGSSLPSEETENEDLKCYFTDKDGFVFDEAPFFSGDVYFRIFGGVNTENPIGSQIYPNLFPKLMQFKEQINKMGLKSVSLVLKENEDVEFLLKESDSGFIPKILLNSKNDMEKTIENLQTAVTSEPLKTELEEKYSKLEYIDLRFGNKVYYRFR